MRILCTFLFFSFWLRYPLVHWSCDYLFKTYIVYIYIYIYDICFFTYLSMCCFFSLFIHMFLYVCNLYFYFTLRCLDKFCLKCFRKIGCKNLSCHELSSCKVFQEFVLGLDLFCIPTSDYEFNDLRLLSRFICLLWFCHGSPKGELVRTYVESVRNICDVN